jgi:2-methylcitrate dehydratase PrpD
MEAQRFVAEEVIPRLRGLLHAHAAWVAVGASVALVALAPTGPAP